jgi:hypothetical protein
MNQAKHRRIRSYAEYGNWGFSNKERNEDFKVGSDYFDNYDSRLSKYKSKKSLQHRNTNSQALEIVEAERRTQKMFGYYER